MIDDSARMIDDSARMIDDSARMIDDSGWMIDDSTQPPLNSGMADGRKCRWKYRINFSLTNGLDRAHCFSQ
jgi:hypothetical protein